MNSGCLNYNHQSCGQELKIDIINDTLVFATNWWGVFCASPFATIIQLKKEKHSKNSMITNRFSFFFHCVNWKLNNWPITMWKRIAYPICVWNQFVKHFIASNLANWTKQNVCIVYMYRYAYGNKLYVASSMLLYSTIRVIYCDLIIVIMMMMVIIEINNEENVEPFLKQSCGGRETKKEWKRELEIDRVE